MRRRKALPVLTCALLIAGGLITPAEAQRRFGGGMHARAPMNFHAPGSGGGGIRNPAIPPGPPPSPGPRPGPGPHPPGPGPGPGPHPPGPGPHPLGPGPGPGPHPPGPPPPPPPPGWGWGWGWDDDPFWDAAAIGIVAGTTAAAISSASEPDVVVIEGSSGVGSVVYALPANCPKVTRASVTYYSCNNIWYRPQYLTSGVSYLIVSPP